MRKLILATLLLLPITSAWGHGKQEVLINDVDARLQRLQLLMDSQNLQEMYLRLETLEQENRNLRGTVEELTHEIKQAKDRERKLYLDMDQRLAAIENGTQPITTTTLTPDYTQDPGVEIGPGTGTEQVGAGAEEAQYRTAFNLLRDKRYNEAVAAFEAFLGAYPSSSLAPNAQYWMGESNYVSGRYDQAIQAFEGVRKNYGGSSKAADASLKIGMSYKAQGKITNAKAVLTDVVSKYPGTKAAQIAQTQLDKWSGSVQ